MRQKRIHVNDLFEHSLLSLYVRISENHSISRALSIKRSKSITEDSASRSSNSFQRFPNRRMTRSPRLNLDTAWIVSSSRPRFQHDSPLSKHHLASSASLQINIDFKMHHLLRCGTCIAISRLRECYIRNNKEGY